MNEKLFTDLLAKKGWHTYQNQEVVKVVVNAYADELGLVESMVGVPCEVVEEFEGHCRRFVAISFKREGTP